MIVNKRYVVSVKGDGFDNMDVLKEVANAHRPQQAGRAPVVAPAFTRSGMPLLLTERDVRAVLSMPDLIEAMERALSAYSSGAPIQPVRTTIEVDAAPSFFAVMPASLTSPAAVGAKLVTVYPGNHDKHLPSHLATIILLDRGDRRPRRADGRPLHHGGAHGCRVGGVRPKHLAAPRCADARASSAAASRRAAISRRFAACARSPTSASGVRPPRTRRPSRAESRAALASRVRVAADAATAVRGADIIVLATASRTPVIARRGRRAGRAHLRRRRVPAGPARDADRARRARARLRRRARRRARRGRRPAAADRAKARSARITSPANWASSLPGRVAGRQSAASRSRSSSRSAWPSRTSSRPHLVVERARAAGLGRSFDLT